MPKMWSPRVRAAAAALALAVVTALVSSGPATAAEGHGTQRATAAGQASSHPPTARACAKARQRGQAACMALVRTDVKARKGLLTPHAGNAPIGYGPADLQRAYNLPSATDGSGQTVAIVDAYDDPTAEADLNTYRAQYGQPPCTSANGCFSKVNQRGEQGSYPKADSGWAEEESLDVDMVSAACPNCHILLVEADSNDINDLGAAVNEAVALGAKYVSNSYGTSGEDPTETSYDDFYNHPGVAVTASSGDSGYGASYPAASPYVTAVGGTTLNPDATVPRGWTERVWGTAAGVQGAGSGCSAYETKPSWQTDSGCANRMIADVSAVADPATGVAVYDTGVGGWVEVGGTSASSPLIAATYALAGPPQVGTVPASYLYDAMTVDATALNDVTTGANGTCPQEYWCTGETGYDGPTGLGTPNGIGAFNNRPHGAIAGTVTDKATGKPIAGAKVKVGSGGAITGADGTYHLNLPVDTYQVTVSDYGYDSQQASVTITADATTTQDFALVGTPHRMVTGAVTAGDGHPWPLYAKVSWSDGSGHDGSVFTTPATGKYALSLLQDADYSLKVTSVYPGYESTSKNVTLAESDVTEDVGLNVDMLACTAIGYRPTFGNGLHADFEGTKAPNGWHVNNANLHYPGYSNTPGWVFGNPGGRANTTGGAGNFAVVDSENAGAHHYQDTTLTTPPTDLSDATSPQLEFGSDLRPAVNSTATVELSTDGGQTWTTVWRTAAFGGGTGPRTVVVPLPQAAGKSQVTARFTYLGEWSQYWEVDDVFLGHRTCAQRDGGLLVGRVTDDKTGVPLNGATVAGVTNPTEQATTVDTPGDTAIGGGFYWLFTTATGQQKFTASMNGYTTGNATAAITAGEVTSQDFGLATSGP